jgi:hypothetical protein
MRTVFAFFFLFLFLTGCEPDRPKNVLPPEKMRLVLYDMMRVDELATERLTTDSSYALLPKNEALYHQVFNVHRTSLEQFKTSLAFYQTHPGQFKEVLDGLQKYLDESQLKSDSIGRIKADSLYRKRPDSTNPLRLSPLKPDSLSK